MKTIITIDTASEQPLVTVLQKNGDVVLDEKETTLSSVYQAFEKVMKAEEQNNGYRRRSGKLPHNCVEYELLAEDGSAYACWIEVPKNRWDISFYNKPFPNVGFPRLLFRYKVVNEQVRGVHVYALPEKQPLTDDMPLYHFPYSNVGGTGSVCTGSIRYPKIDTPRMLETLHILFFASDFNHDLSAGTGDLPVGELFKMMQGADFDDSLLKQLPAHLQV